MQDLAAVPVEEGRPVQMPLRQLLLAEAEGVDPLGHIGAEGGDAFHLPGGEEKGAQQQGRQGDAPQPRAPAQGRFVPVQHP